MAASPHLQSPATGRGSSQGTGRRAPHQEARGQCGWGTRRLGAMLCEAPGSESPSAATEPHAHHRALAGQTCAYGAGATCRVPFPALVRPRHCGCKRALNLFGACRPPQAALPSSSPRRNHPGPDLRAGQSAGVSPGRRGADPQPLPRLCSPQRDPCQGLSQGRVSMTMASAPALGSPWQTQVLLDTGLGRSLNLRPAGLPQRALEPPPQGVGQAQCGPGWQWGGARARPHAACGAPLMLWASACAWERTWGCGTLHSGPALSGTGVGKTSTELLHTRRSL